MNPARHLTTAIAAGLFALGAQATPVTYDFTLQATGIGNVLPVFGISSLPAGPFSGSFTVDAPLAPNQNLAPVVLTAFAATVGNFTWTLPDVVASNFSTDAAGEIDPAHLLIEAAHGPSGSPQQTLNLYNGVPGYSNLGWYAIDPAAATYCSFAFNPPYTGPNGGGCIGGGSETPTITLVERQETPEPATLLLTALGLFGLAARRR